MIYVKVKWSFAKLTDQFSEILIKISILNEKMTR